MTVDLEKMSLPELTQLQKDVSKAIKTFEQRQRKEALEAAEAAAREAGFALSDLIGSGKKTGKQAAPAKYRHPENPAMTWSGRGRQPAWYKEQIEAGASMDDLLIT